MGQVFSSKPKPKPKAKPTLSQQDRAILDLKLARDKLRAYQARMEGESSALLTRAQACLKEGNKRKALYYMKVKKLKEAKIDELNSELLNIEKMAHSIEWATQSIQVVGAMEAANGALEAAQRALPLERVDALMEALADHADAQAEMDRALGGQGQLTSLDESELESELAALAKSIPALSGPIEPNAKEAKPGGEFPLAAPEAQPTADRAAGSLEAALPAPPEGPVLPDAPTSLPAHPTTPTPETQDNAKDLALAAA